MPQVYIRDHVYDRIIDAGIKTRDEIKDFVNDVVLGSAMKLKDSNNPTESENQDNE